MRRLIICTTAVVFLCGQTAGAFPQSEVSDVKSYIQKVGWNKKAIKLKDLYESEKENLPLPLRFEIESLLEKHPQAELPKVEVRMIKNGKHEDMQLIAQKGKQAATLTLKMRDRVAAELTHTFKGKDIKNKFTYAEIFDPTRMIAQVYDPQGQSYADQIGFARLLRAKELAALTPDDRLKYADSARELLRVAERAQNAMELSAPQNNKKDRAPAKKTIKKTSSLAPQILEVLLGKKANAMGYSPGRQPSGPCLVMGWVGTFKNGKCEPPKESWDETKKCHRCSTTFYGKEAQCGLPSLPEGSASTAELCNNRTADKRFDFFAGIKSQEEFDKKQDEISLEINKVRAMCKEAKNPSTQECKDLEFRFLDLTAVNCEYLTKWKEQFTDLKCAGVTAGQDVAKVNNDSLADEQQHATADVVQENLDNTGVDGVVNNNGGQINQGTMVQQTQYQYQIGNQGACAGLPPDPSLLKCDQGGGTIVTRRCTVGGSVRAFYYCACMAGVDEIRENSVEPTACRPIARNRNGDELLGPVPKRDRNGDELLGPVKSRHRNGDELLGRVPARDRREKQSFWQANGGWGGFLGGAATIGLAFLMYRMQQNQVQSMYGQYYRMYQPQQLQIAPLLTPVTTNPNINYPANVIPGTR